MQGRGAEPEDVGAASRPFLSPHKKDRHDGRPMYCVRKAGLTL